VLRLGRGALYEHRVHPSTIIEFRQIEFLDPYEIEILDNTRKPLNPAADADLATDTPV
jgi:hypothetical protein